MWQAFGPHINNYVEPFAGSCAVLLGRPGGPGKIETVNDRDRMIANFWRAVTADPERVAHYANWPVNECDLHARHRWLVDQLPSMREKMHQDPMFFDALIAGWWVWGICQWIGGGWCVESENRKHPKLDGIGKGIHSNAGHPAVTADGSCTCRGVLSNVMDRKRPHMAGLDKGVNRVQSTWKVFIVGTVSNTRSVGCANAGFAARKAAARSACMGSSSVRPAFVISARSTMHGRSVSSSRSRHSSSRH